MIAWVPLPNSVLLFCLLTVHRPTKSTESCKNHVIRRNTVGVCGRNPQLSVSSARAFSRERGMWIGWSLYWEWLPISRNGWAGTFSEPLTSRSRSFYSIRTTSEFHWSSIQSRQRGTWWCQAAKCRPGLLGHLARERSNCWYGQLCDCTCDWKDCPFYQCSALSELLQFPKSTNMITPRKSIPVSSTLLLFSVWCAYNRVE